MEGEGGGIKSIIIIYMRPFIAVLTADCLPDISWRVGRHDTGETGAVGGTSVDHGKLG